MEFLGSVITAKGGGIHGYCLFSGESTPKEKLFVMRHSFAAEGHIEAYFFDAAISQALRFIHITGRDASQHLIQCRPVL
jgi:hypothetical protein